MVVGSQRSGGNILGSVYVFTRSGPAGSWQEAAQLNATDGENSWGWNPKVSGDVVIAGDPDTGDGTRPGVVYVFVKPALGWTGMTETARLVPSTTSSTPIGFGTSTDIAGSVIAVGARSDGGGQGRGYVFVEPPGGWSGTLTEDAVLAPSVSTLQLGAYRGVVTDGDTVVLRPASNFSSNTGLYFYQKPALGWSGTLTENAYKALWGDIDLDAGTLIVNRFRAAGDDSEDVLLFERPASGIWTSTLVPTESIPHEDTGQRVDASLDGSTAVIGQYVYVASGPTLPVLTVTKGDTPDPVVVNGDLTYTIIVQNNGPGDVTEVRATDTLPAGVIYNGSSPAGDCTVDSIVGGVTIVSCTMRDLPEGDLTSVQLNVTAPGITGQITNTVTVDATGISAPVIANENTDVVDAASDLEVILFDHDPEPVSAGSTLGYFVDVINNGPSDATAVTVTVGLPSGTTFIDAVARNALGQTIIGACVESSSIVCDMGTVEAGGTVEVDVNVTAPTTAGIVTNTANVVSAVADPGPGPNTATDQVTVVVDGVDITDSVNAPGDFLLDFGMVEVGSSVAGTITVTNNRADPVTVTVSPTLTMPFSNATNTCAGSDLPAGVSCEVSVLFEPTQSDVGGTLSDTFELDVGGTTVPFTVTGKAVEFQADLNITFFARPSVSFPTVTQYDIHIKNEGPDDAEGFYMTLDLPFQAVGPALFSGDPIGDLLECTNTILGTGRQLFHCDLPSPEIFPEGVTANLSVGVNRSGTLGPATLTVGAATDDPNLSNNTRDIDVPNTDNNGSGGRSIECWPTIDDTSSPQSRGQNGIFYIGMTSLLLWGWSRSRRRKVRTRR
jgi:uncharacterized repeat protein (TIGR01451 family)